MPFFVYILICSDKKQSVYVGATVDLNERLRKHNREISGGADETGIEVFNGHTWKRAGHVAEFPTWKEALKFEWRWHITAERCIRMRKENGTGTGTKRLSNLERNIEALRRVLARDRPTDTSIKYTEWDNGKGPILNWELNQAEQVWNERKELPMPPLLSAFQQAKQKAIAKDEAIAKKKQKIKDKEYKMLKIDPNHVADFSAFLYKP
jgi:predicted GIY-YIG superfamily endonuclease